MRRAARIDNSQQEIVKALRKIGATVSVRSDVGHGFPDLVVGWRGKNFLVECKTGDSGLTADEKKFHESWGGSVLTASTAEEAVLAVINEHRKAA